MTKRRVVITGLGTVNACALNAPDSWAKIRAGESGIGPLTRFDQEGYASTVVGELPNFDPTVAVEKHEVKRFDPFIQYALVASKEAVEDSAIDPDQLDLDRAGVLIGSGIGGLVTIEDQYSMLLKRGPRRVSPYFVPKIMMNAASGQVSIQYGFRGPNFATASACATATHSVGLAYRLISYGEMDLALTGGSEAVITPLCMAGFCALKALSTSYNDTPEKASRPFDKDRDGFVLGEGAGILMFEELEHAKARGAKIYAEVKGFAQTADAFNIVQPAPEGRGAAKAMELAIKDSGLDPTTIDYINAHGTSTPFNDRLETEAIKTVFGDHAYDLAISSTKSMIGHLLGASGAAELIMTAYSVANDELHPTINHETPDPDCDLDYVPNEGRKTTVRNALSNSLGFGGHNATIIIGKLEE
jgi:3-oxoacyl-[acyl-carrier-protein] synthase II